ncbi:MAG: UDP-N-acetylglucosamine--N-acetylmuramyl-(pentapeptide) pyrophosphoryl-undecaprenol N-acetylglucosamine transferase [Phycisphaeraceae bacterium]|nr:MAG: UDP-N-acetylglucosamine--N-acetylmuramyl-(pentapeptide) pyrophosphoryl-undecaprenol N-acetylglucosamine transferase [Phycisphaeraceae bacterium]
MPTRRAFIFAGGGSGGHLYPGLAIAERLAERDPDAESLFICSDKPLDARLLAAEGVAFRPIPARPFSPRPVALLRLLRQWGTCVRLSRQAIRELRREKLEVHVVAMGGYAAAPVVQAARVEGIRVTLVNLDATPGKANRWIARHAAQRFTSAPIAGQSADWSVVPSIVRRAAIATATKEECRRSLGLDPSLPTLLVTGASQGATSINAFMAALAMDQPGLFTGWQVYHQSGEGKGTAGPQDLLAAYESAGVRAVIEPFCHDMASAWGGADLAVSRCGAGNVGEVWANAVPTLFLPYPFHRDQHQKHNARPLVEVGGAELVEDLIDSQKNLMYAGAALAALLSDAVRRDRMRAALRGLGPADGADRVSAALLAPEAYPPDSARFRGV